MKMAIMLQKDKGEACEGLQAQKIVDIAIHTEANLLTL
jgi:hypothetical protein